MFLSVAPLFPQKLPTSYQSWLYRLKFLSNVVRLYFNFMNVAKYVPNSAFWKRTYLASNSIIYTSDSTYINEIRFAYNEGQINRLLIANWLCQIAIARYLIESTFRPRLYKITLKCTTLIMYWQSFFMSVQCKAM